MINPSCGVDNSPTASPHPSPPSTISTSRSGNGNANFEKKPNGWAQSPARFQKHNSHHLDDDNVEAMEQLSQCCFGKFDSRSCLQLLALLNFLLDGLCTYLGLEHMFISYIFAGCAVVSLLSLCAVINGIQEEKKLMIKMTAMYAGIKAVVLGALTLTAYAGIIEEHLTNDQFRPSFEVKALFILLPIFVLSLSAQYQLSQKIVQLYRLKDELYVISAANLPIVGHEFSSGWWNRKPKEHIRPMPEELKV